MFNESLLFKEEHEVKAGNILSSIRKLDRSIITIYGESGSGKSEVAWWLARKLYKENVPAYVVSLDRFYKIPVNCRTKYRIETGDIGWDEMDWTRVNTELINFLYKYKAFKYLIVEGLYGGYIKQKDYKIYLEADDTYEFRKKRGKENPDDTWRKYVLFRESRDVKESKQFANLVI